MNHSYRYVSWSLVPHSIPIPAGFPSYLSPCLSPPSSCWHAHPCPQLPCPCLSMPVPPTPIHRCMYTCTHPQNCPKLVSCLPPMSPPVPPYISHPYHPSLAVSITTCPGSPQLSTSSLTFSHLWSLSLHTTYLSIPLCIWISCLESRGTLDSTTYP